MKHSSVLAAATLGLIVASGWVWANHEEKGEGKDEVALKHRVHAPKDTDIDATVSLQALLDKSGKDAWSTQKAAHVEGFVVQVEHEPDNDVKLVLAANQGETDTRHWVIVEVCPELMQKTPALAEPKLRAMVGKKVAVTGWLYREPEGESDDPRGTLWEIHPATAIEAR
jgi:hypothetical protein